MVRDFNEIISVAAARKGGLLRLEDVLAATPIQAPSVIATLADDRILAEMTRWVFYAGFSSRVVNEKWPAFETAFQNFDLQANASIREEQLCAIAQDPNIVRNRAKIWAVRTNARLLLDLAALKGTAACFIAQWPDDDYVGLLGILKGRGSHLTGHAAMRFLRALGKPAFITTTDVVTALIREGVLQRPPTRRADFATIQSAFNHWSHQSGRDLTQISRILAISTGDVELPQ